MNQQDLHQQKTDQLEQLKSFINTNLNHEQQQAVTPNHGAFLVIAGAGSGKTRVITTRIINLILEHGVEPSSIIALTFTNKAAQEMQHRIAKFLPNLRTKPHIATFHAYCLKLLKQHAYLQSKPAFTILDAQDAQKLLQNITKERGVDRLFNAKQLLPMFSTIKMHDILGTELPLWNMHNMQQFMELYNAYQQQKNVSNYVDFDDLLYKTYELFKNHEGFKERHLQNHRHVLIDEYQDTNVIQHELLKQMSLHNKQFAIDSICAVGDEDQSIYSWRGATIQNILDFHHDYPSTKKIKLEQNYRSTQQILDIANSVIKNNVNRNHKQLWSASTKKHTPLVLECLSDLQEASIIVQLIAQLSQKESRASIAILYRTHYQSRIIEEALIKESIPYKIIGGIQFYERKEIKDLLAYLRLVINPFDRISFFRVVNCPLRGLGEKFEELFASTWMQNPLSSFQEIAQELLQQNMLPAKQAASLKSFVDLFTSELPEKTVTEIMQHFVTKTAYHQYLQDSYEKQEAQEKIENIAEFIRAAQYFDQNSKAGVSQFLDEIALMQEQMKKDDDSTERVHMMTLHAAKGLEFNNVIISGLEEGILPSNQSVAQENTEEERRLFYVGITRAQEKLLITTSKYRNVFGKLDQQRPSRFLQEIPANLIVYQAASHWSRSGFQTFLQNWLEQKQLKSNHTPAPTAKSTTSFFSRNIATPKSSSSKPLVSTNTAPTTSSTSNAINSPIKRLQPVEHPTFGFGIAHDVQQKGDKFIITVQFTKHGSKKIDSNFLKKI